MDHGPYPWVTQDASAAPPRAPLPPTPAPSNPFAPPAVPPPPPAAGQGPPRAPWNSHEAMLPGAAALPPQRKLTIRLPAGAAESRPPAPSRGGRGRGGPAPAVPPPVPEAAPQWVQCDGCQKWRRLPAHVDVASLPERWFCSMNRWDSQRNQCSYPEEVAPAAAPVRQSPSPEPNNDALAEAEAAAAAQAQIDADVLPVSYGDERLASKNALEFELPRATTAKLTKRFLGPKEAKDQELQAAMARAGGLFAMTVTYAATDVCLENKRQTIGPQDVLTALDALGFEQDDLDSLSQFLERDKERRPKHTSGDGKKYRGVYQGSINAWYSQISIGGQPIHLGSYAAPADAAKAYDRAIWSKLGVEAAALLNFPELIPESLPYVAEAKQRQMEQEAEKARQRDEKIRLREEKEALREQRRLEKEEKKRLKKPAKRRKKDPGEAGFYK